jgi:hypothetical protein
VPFDLGKSISAARALLAAIGRPAHSFAPVVRVTKALEPTVSGMGRFGAVPQKDYYGCAKGRAVAAASARQDRQQWRDT